MGSRLRHNTPINDVELAEAIAKLYGEVGTTIGKTVIIEELLMQFAEEHIENLKSIKIHWDEKNDAFTIFSFNFK